MERQKNSSKDRGVSEREQDLLVDFFSYLLKKEDYKLIDEHNSLHNLESKPTPEAYFKEYRKYNILFPQMNLCVIIGQACFILKNKINLKDVLAYTITNENIDRLKKDLAVLHGNRGINPEVTSDRLIGLTKSFNFHSVVAVYKTMCLMTCYFTMIKGSKEDFDHLKRTRIGYINLDSVSELLKVNNTYDELLSFFEKLTDALNSEKGLALSKERLSLINYNSDDVEVKRIVREKASINEEKIKELLIKTADNFFYREYGTHLTDRQLDLLSTYFSSTF